MTPLETEIRRIIAAEGPMTVARYMAIALMHPVHGYYTSRDPFGARGDFTTSPEISQMFGELIGLWAAAVWQLMGAPNPVRLVELGPGRGTLMNDALRAAAIVPDFRAALSVHLVEMSPLLRERQEATLRSHKLPLSWHDNLAAVPRGPLLVIANEFFDALPVHQVVKTEDGWHERMVGLDPNNRLAFAFHRDPIHLGPLLPLNVRASPEGSLFEWRSENAAFELGQRLVQAGGAALVIDYGHVESGVGDTFQAVSAQGYADPLQAPGEADLTAHVDFAALGRAAQRAGAAIHGPITQRTLLRRLGIEERAHSLKARATREQEADINAALARLTATGPTGMGDLFKAMVIAHPQLSSFPGFDD
jgi:SAM-dependent MidA family methyltransferase